MYCKMNKKLGWEPWRKQALQLRDLLPWGSLNHAKSLADSQDFKGQVHHQLYIKRAAKQDCTHVLCTVIVWIFHPAYIYKPGAIILFCTSIHHMIDGSNSSGSRGTQKPNWQIWRTKGKRNNRPSNEGRTTSNATVLT